MGKELKQILGIFVAGLIGAAIFWFWSQYRPNDPQLYSIGASLLGFILSYAMILKMEG